MIVSTPRFRELRQLAAESQAERLRKEGRRVVVRLRKEPNAKSPNHKVPAIYEESELARHAAEVANAATTGRRPDQIPPPVPLLDYASWTFYPTCPRCHGRRLNVLDGSEDPYISGFKVHEVERIAGLPPQTHAACLRPILNMKGVADCGWKGTVAELEYRCVKCGHMKPDCASGVCADCR